MKNVHLLTRVRILYVDLLVLLPKRISDFVRRLTHFLEIELWVARGRPTPPPHPVKSRALLSIAKRKNLTVLVETGTYLGEMIMSTKDRFDQVYSVELNKVLANRARNKFGRFKNIKIIQGDSAKKLPGIIKKLNSPAIFWLDAHYSGGITAKGDQETPIEEEVKLILKNKKNIRHVILIDDAREFTGEHDYPKLSEFKKQVKKMSPKVRIAVKDDLIRIT